MKKTYILSILLLLSVTNVFARSNDNWFVSLSAGTSNTDYTFNDYNFNNYYIDSGSSGYTTQDTAFAIDAGLYGIATRKTLVGISMNMAGDLTERNSGYGDALFMNTLIGGSVMYFPAGRVGSGFFLRADAGRSQYYFNPEYGHDFYSDWGWGALGGVGLALDFTNTSLILNANYSYRTAPKDFADYSSGTFAFTAGFLF